MPRERYVQASEIGNYAFCHRAWHLDRAGVQSTLGRERAAGIARHHQHSQRVRAAGRARTVAPWFAAAAVVLVLLALALALR